MRSQRKTPVPAGSVGSFSLLLGVAILIIVAAFSLLAGELALRLVEGQSLSQLQLHFPTRFRRPLRRSLVEFGARHTAGGEFDPAWIDMDPPKLPRKGELSGELAAIRDGAFASASLRHTAFWQWNEAWLQSDACVTGGLFEGLSAPVLVFDAPDRSRLPIYRYWLGKHVRWGLVTNRFGWRGPEIPLDKSAKTIRLAFVGASTTVGSHILPFSYPEYVVHWLNLWAKKTGTDVRFDGINAGREGMDSENIVAIIETEVLPMEPDLVLYYEGVNQFDLAPLVVSDVLPSSQLQPSTLPRWRRMLELLQRYSVLARRGQRLADGLLSNGGREPVKPHYELRWPATVDEGAPDPSNPDLPLDLPVIVRDLRRIHERAEAAGSDLALASFVWLAHDGLRVDPVADAWFLYFYRTRQWPFRYADIRRLIDFQNRVYRRFAERDGVLYVDLAEKMPMSIEFFSDGVHFNADGIRVQAWLVATALLPHVKQRLAEGNWPRPDQAPLRSHPYIREPRVMHEPCR